jgi:hypothetical protein
MAVTQCDSCRINKDGFCSHYGRPVPKDGPYPNWEFCLQLLDEPVARHHVFPSGELMALKANGRWERFKPRRGVKHDFG